QLDQRAYYRIQSLSRHSQIQHFDCHLAVCRSHLQGGSFYAGDGSACDELARIRAATDRCQDAGADSVLERAAALSQRANSSREGGIRDVRTIWIQRSASQTATVSGTA